MIVQTIGDVLDDLDRDADQPASIVFGESGSRTLTRGEFSGAIAALAGRLSGRGVEKGDCVAVCGSPSAEWMLAALAIMRLGGVVVPIDAQVSDSNLAHILRDSDPACLFTDEAHQERLKDLDLGRKPDVILLDQIEADKTNAAPESGQASALKVNSEDSAVMFYTSGTTGAPKGVPLTHANLAFQINTIAAVGIATERDRMLLALPLHHVYPFTMGMLLPLAVKAPIVLPQTLTGPKLVEALAEGKVSVILGVPRLYRALYDGIRARAASKGRLTKVFFNSAARSSAFLYDRLGLSVGRAVFRSLHKRFGNRLRLMASGGSALDPKLGRKLEGMGWPVAIGYGLTETSPLLTLRLPGKGPIQSVGRAVQGVEIRIGTGERDEENDAASGNGSLDGAGEIVVRGPGVFKGYRNREEETKRAFTQDGWFRTGDVGRLDKDGYLYITGRVSTLIVTESGENIQPQDLEREYEKHAYISEIGILEKDRKLVGLVVADTRALSDAGETDREEAVRRAVREQSRKIPSYMGLSDIRISRTALPRTRLGKIRRHLLTERYDEAADDRIAGQGKPVSYDDMSDRDRALLEKETARRVWEWLCERFPDYGLAPDSSLYMDLDVESLDWLNLSIELQDRTGVELGQESLARIETVRDLLDEATNASPSPEGHVDPIDDPERVLSDRQKRWITPLGPVLYALAWIVYWLGSGALRLLYRVRVVGREHVSEPGPCVLAPNHASFLDPFVLGHVLGSRKMWRTYWASLAQAAFNNAAKRFGCRLGRAVPINQQQGAISSIAFAAAVLKRGHRLVWFPEGQRSTDGRLQPLKPGLGKILNKLSVPVVPVWIGGTHKVWPVGQRLPRPGRLSVTFGEPVSVDDLKREGDGETEEERILSGLGKRMAAMSEQDTPNQA